MDDSHDGKAFWSGRRVALSWLLTTAICVMIVAGFFPHRNHAPVATSGKTPATALAVDPAALDFGERLENQPFFWSFPVTNMSSQSVTVDRVETSCNCAGVEPKSFTIGTGGKATLQLHLDLHPHGGDPSDVSHHEIRVLAYVGGEQSQPATPQVWTVKGTTRSILEIKPRICDFADELHQGAQNKTLTLAINPRVPIRDLAADGPSGWSVGIRSDGPAYLLDVQPPTNLSAGTLNAVVKLRLLAADGREYPVVNVPIRGEVIGEVQTVPKQVRIGARPINTVSAASLAFESASGSSLAVIKAAAGPGIQIRSLGPACIAFLCTTQTRGDGQSFVEATVRLQDGRERKVRAEVSYYGY